MQKTVAVFFGGRSNEREISVITGMLAVNLLRRTEWEVVPVYLPPEGGMQSSRDMRAVADFTGKKFPAVRLEGNALIRAGKKKPFCHIDCALNCCHGGMGEDGTLAALLAFHGIPSASPAADVSAVFMNKELTKIAATGLGIPTARAFCVRENRWLAARNEVLSTAETFGYPVIVKPVRLGSSIGISVARRASELVSALDLAFRLDDAALVEEYIEGKRDVNCAAVVRGGKVELSPLEEVFSGGALLSFEEKYEGAGGRKSECPAVLDEKIAEGIRASVRRIAEAFSLRGVVRADFIVSGDEFYFNELNTVPGSLALYLFSSSLTESRDFLLSLLEEAKPPEKREVFTSGILSSDLFSAKGGKRALPLR